ncbi:hypothetical protein K2173_000902 [Erythroxylum novogranatense]|uniref:Protein kinase domain-containing protein n=1 Tax=Erythroxylum novogranatense TaxID=1862640 RepID=A0AAV8TQG6_9ROSI|nr:hypothetical protein K2173_000902 [Erythroxylum novogranatense]
MCEKGSQWGVFRRVLWWRSMKLVSERTVGTAEEDGDGGEGEVVVVGVKLDVQSKELLTWALMKVANPGDRVIALHVLDSVSGGTSSLMSLVKAFDSLLAVYEGFCNLKQVDLKLKVCRGFSVRKILVREAKSSNANKVVVGTSKSPHRIRSSTSVAKYCARKLSKSLSIYAVSNGKFVYTREATVTVVGCSGKDIKLLSDTTYAVVADKLNQVSQSCSGKSQNKNSVHSTSGSLSPNDSKNQLLELYSIQRSDTIPKPNSVALSSSKQRWSLLRRLILGKNSTKRTSLAKWALALSSQNSSSVVYPDQKQYASDTLEGHCFDVEAENGAIVPVGPEVVWSPISPHHGLSDLPEELKGIHEKYSSTCRLFCYEELLSATSNFTPGWFSSHTFDVLIWVFLVCSFSSILGFLTNFFWPFVLENMVGKGGSSHVYKGCLPDGKELAVKILKPSAYMLKEFVSEIEIITKLHHKNLMSLFGFCFEDNKLILVYDFLSRGSLEENLHGNKISDAFGWKERYKVALGVAEALEYVHNYCDKPIVHKDVKSSNILLSDDFEPQLSDFGLASCISSGLCHVTSPDVSGTFGYLAPEYFLHGKVSEKVDVFAFGVVLLELLSGKLPINSENPKCHESLVMWAKPILEGGKISELLDRQVRGDRDDNQIERMVLAATLSIRRSPRSRPDIGLILKLLQGDREAMDSARQQVSASEETDAADGEPHLNNIQSHLRTALLDLEDDCNSVSSTEQDISIEDYLKGRFSRTPSFE